MAENSAVAGQAAEGTDSFAQAHARLLHDSAIQFDLPRYAPPRVPDWLRELLEALGTAGPALRWLVTGALIAGVIVIAYLMATALTRFYQARQRSGHGRPTEEEWRPEAGPARALLAEADALAASGRFAEAARHLLWRSLEDIDARRPDLLKPALTSRDIAQAEALPTEARTAFTVIARAVEAGLFARRGLDSAVWRECREAYERFAFPRAWA